MTRAREQRGSALVTALMVMGLIMVLGVALLDLAGSVQRRTGDERVKERSFTIADAALAAQVRTLSAAWPGSAAAATPASCTRASTSPRCLSASALVADYAAAGLDRDASWTVEVRDNVGAAATYYTRAGLATAWDSNGDGALWVRAEGSVRGRSRTVVALARQQLTRMPLPRNTILAGYFTTSNNGLKTIVDEKGCEEKHNPSPECNTTQPAPVAVRCETATPGTVSDLCLGYRPSQISPDLTQQGVGHNVLTPQQLAQVQGYARQLGTYHTTCPSAAALTAPVVFIDGASCTYVTGVANSAAAPGVLVVNRGVITLGGNFTFHGVVYASNNLAPPADAANLVVLQGTAFIKGSVLVDGRGGMLAGASGLNVSFDENALGRLTGLHSAVSIVQNSFRELPRGK